MIATGLGFGVQVYSVGTTPTKNVVFKKLGPLAVSSKP